MAKITSTPGIVHAVSMSHDGKTANLTIHHGPPAKASKANPFPDQPQTVHTIAAKHAQHFPVGKSVKMTLSTAPNEEAGESSPDNEDQETATVPSKAIGKGFMVGKAKG